MGTIITLPGPKPQPLRQGELDGLCGLYAAINAIRLGLALRRPLDRFEIRRLFGHGVAFLADRHQLACATLVGFDPELWPALVDALTGLAARMTGVPITGARPLALVRLPTLIEVFAVIDEAVSRRQPVLIELGGRYEHYTVVSDCTPSSLTLFDSGSLQRLGRTACGVEGTTGEPRHVLKPQALIALEVG